MKSRATRTVVVGLLASCVAACSLVLGLDPLEVGSFSEEGGRDDSATLVDANGADGTSMPDSAAEASLADAAPDATADSSASDGSVEGDAGVPPCSATPPPTNAVYVSARIRLPDAAAPTGSATAPFSSITAARNKARLTKSVILVDQGTYAEALELESFAVDTIIDGGWTWDGASTWTIDCTPDRKTRTLVKSPADKGVFIHDNTGVLTLTNLSIESRPTATTGAGADQPGASRYGVFVRSSLVKLVGVSVRAYSADDGGVATSGESGAAQCTTSTSACSGPPGPPPNPGGDAPAVLPAAAGTFGAADFSPGNGAMGVAGGNGSNGTPGGPGSSRSDCFNGCNSQPSCEVANAPKSETSNPGECGCGGTGGKAGLPGRGGGGSFAIYASDGTTLVDVTFSELVAGNGGAGSAGGAGGKGGAATNGRAGTAPVCYPPTCCRNGTCPNCGCFGGSNWSSSCSQSQPAPLPLAGGTAGGNGFPGGNGATGGGGAGGPSFVYVLMGGAQLTIDASSTAFGAGGAGQGGAPDGASGVSP